MFRKLVGNKRAPELLTKRTYTYQTNVWHIGYLAYLFGALKFNFQRKDPADLETLAPNFYKVLEKSKIRSLFPKYLFDTIFNMLQPDSTARATWGNLG